MKYASQVGRSRIGEGRDSVDRSVWYDDTDELELRIDRCEWFRRWAMPACGDDGDVVVFVVVGVGVP